MHRSRLAGFIIDCQNADPDTAAHFWSAALGMKAIEKQGEKYMVLDAAERDLYVEVQSVEHESRVHVDIETDDVDREVARLEALGARRLEQRGTWWVMESPTGQRFCVVHGKNMDSAAGLNEWK